MSTGEVNMLNWTMLPDGNCYVDRIGNQISAANEIGAQLCVVMAGHTQDEGFQGSFNVPANYASGGTVLIKGILDGAPGADVGMGFAIQGLSLADNEAGDAAYNAEDVCDEADIDDYADEDLYMDTIALSNFGTLAVGDTAFFLFVIDNTNTDYAGNFLLTDLVFQYTVA